MRLDHLLSKRKCGTGSVRSPDFGRRPRNLPTVTMCILARARDELTSISCTAYPASLRSRRSLRLRFLPFFDFSEVASLKSGANPAALMPNGRLTDRVPSVGGIAQLARAMALQAIGQGFESPYLHVVAGFVG